MKAMERGLIFAVAGVTAAFVVYVFLFEREWGVGLLKAVFGLSGGTTVGG